jgi:hypothetical protein
MSDFWSRAKSSLNDAAEASKRAALRAKARGELEMLRRRLAKLKHDFGSEVYPIWADRAKAEAVYTAYRVKIEAQVALIEAKQREIDQLSGVAPPPPAERSAAARHTTYEQMDDPTLGPTMQEI